MSGGADRPAALAFLFGALSNTPPCSVREGVGAGGGRAGGRGGLPLGQPPAKPARRPVAVGCGPVRRPRPAGCGGCRPRPATSSRVQPAPARRSEGGIQPRLALETPPREGASVGYPPRTQHRAA